MSYFLIKNLIFLEDIHLRHVRSVIHAKKHLLNILKCVSINFLWLDLVWYFQNSLELPTVTPQTFIFGILDSASKQWFHFKKQ